jgi:hypothetical protein
MAHLHFYMVDGVSSRFYGIGDRTKYVLFVVGVLSGLNYYEISTNG